MTKENKQTDDTVYVYNTISVDNMYIPKPRNKNKKKHPLLQKNTKLTPITNFTKSKSLPRLSEYKQRTIQISKQKELEKQKK